MQSRMHKLASTTRWHQDNAMQLKWRLLALLGAANSVVSIASCMTQSGSQWAEYNVQNIIYKFYDFSNFEP